MPEPLSFVSAEFLEPLLKRLLKELQRIGSDRAEELRRIGNDFSDPKKLARYYIEPDCQHHNPADYDEDNDPASPVRSGVFRTINDFFNKDVHLRGGRTQMFVLADAGMGSGLVAQVPALAHLERFDFGGRSLLNRNSEGAFRFSHYSVQEYLVADAVANGWLPAVGESIRGTPVIADFLLQAGALAQGLRVFRKDLFRHATFADTLKDRSRGPEMVVIPPREFWMGSDKAVDPEAYNDEQPRHKVSITRPFAVGRYAVTFDVYDRFCEATGRGKPKDQGWGRGRRPVINVSWEDAAAYTRWLAEQTGKGYRLPSEAEWEYAARGTEGRKYPWGSEAPDAERANYGGRLGKTSEVGSYPRGAAPEGIQDLAGNVWEWVQDCWHGSYEGAPDDGSAWEEESCALRVLRGGSWGNGPGDVRSAGRVRDAPDYRNYFLGFRLAQDL